MQSGAISVLPNSWRFSLHSAAGGWCLLSVIWLAVQFSSIGLLRVQFLKNSASKADSTKLTVV